MLPSIKTLRLITASQQASRPYSRLMARYLARERATHIKYNHVLDEDGCRWVEHPEDGLRFAGRADKLARIGHTGWFLDEFQDETVWGVVYMLPHGKFIPGTEDSYGNDGVRLDFGDIRDTAEDAARAADRIAELWAEKDRDYQAEESRKMRLEDIAQEIEDARTAVRELCRGIRASVMADSVCVAIRKVIRQYRRDVAKLYREREELTV
mgnify:CR=1 FL=1